MSRLLDETFGGGLAESRVLERLGVGRVTLALPS